MDPEEFVAFVRQTIAENVYAGPACDCCGTSIDPDSIADAARIIAEKYATVTSAPAGRS